MILAGSLLFFCGSALMIWGTLWLLKPVEVVTILHPLGISDTLGALLIILGLVLRYPEFIIPLSLAALAILVWGPLVTYVIARGCSRITGKGDHGAR